MKFSTAQFFDLSVGAPVRLMMMQTAFEHHPKEYPNCPEHAKPKSWRDVRGTNYQSINAYIGALSQGLNDGEPVWYTHTGPAFRNEQAVHDMDGGPSHKGWYTEHDGATCKDGSGLCWGIVGLLPHGRFIAGYYWGDNGERVYFPEVYADADDAISAADEHARVYAESCQEDSQKQEYIREAEERVEGLEDNLKDDKARLIEVLALRHKPGFEYAAKRAKFLIELIRSHQEKLEEAREALKKAEDD